MKKLTLIASSVIMLSLSSAGFAQEKDTTSAKYHYEKGLEKTAGDVKEGTDEVSDKATKMAKEGEAKIADQEYELKVGPDGQTIYIDEQGKYYYINDEGTKVFVAEKQLKDKPKDE